MLRKPSILPDKDPGGVSEEKEEDVQRNASYKEEAEVDEWVDWEDQILEDTVPLVGFVRMILHSGKYVTPYLGSSLFLRFFLSSIYVLKLNYFVQFRESTKCGNNLSKFMIRALDRNYHICNHND